MKYDRDELVRMIAVHEGIVLNVYQDHLGIDTIGIGRNLQDRGITDGELLFINKTIDDVYENGLTEEEAYYLCMNDIAIVEKELLQNKPIVNQLDAVRQMVLVDMACMVYLSPYTVDSYSQTDTCSTVYLWCHLAFYVGRYCYQISAGHRHSPTSNHNNIV